MIRKEITLIRFAGFRYFKFTRAGGTILVVVVFFTLANRALYPVMYVVANSVRGLLDRTRSEEHLQSYNESVKTKQNKTQNKETVTQSTCQKKIEEGHCKGQDATSW